MEKNLDEVSDVRERAEIDRRVLQCDGWASAHIQYQLRKMKSQIKGWSVEKHFMEVERLIFKSQ